GSHFCRWARLDTISSYWLARGGSWHPAAPRNRRPARAANVFMGSYSSPRRMSLLSFRAMRKAILFDLDGVLVDTYEVWFQLLNEVARRHGYAPIGADAYRQSWGQGIEVDVKLYYTRHTVEQIRDEHPRYYGDFLHHLKVMEGADRSE